MPLYSGFSFLMRPERRHDAASTGAGLGFFLRGLGAGLPGGALLRSLLHSPSARPSRCRYLRRARALE